jgi:hypothetical protein
MKSVLFSFCLIATAVFALTTPYPVHEANLERDGALEAAIPSSLNRIPSTQLAVLQADEREVHAVVVDMPQRASLEHASPETWGTLPTFDPPYEQSPYEQSPYEQSPATTVLQVAMN